MTRTKTVASKNGAVEFDFSYADVGDKVVEFPIRWLRGSPVLMMRPAGDANPGYQAGLVVTTGARRIADVAQKRGGISEVQEIETGLTLDREDDYGLYRDHVVVGWRGVLDKNGKDVPFTKENCDQFLRALPGWVFDKVRAFALLVRNYIDLEPPPATELAENS